VIMVKLVLYQEVELYYVLLLVVKVGQGLLIIKDKMVLEEILELELVEMVEMVDFG